MRTIRDIYVMQDEDGNIVTASFDPYYGFEEFLNNLGWAEVSEITEDDYPEENRVSTISAVRNGLLEFFPVYVTYISETK